MTLAAVKPFLFLDCDGVVSPLPPRDPDERDRVGVPPGYFSFDRAFWGMYFDERIHDWITQLDAAFAIIWSSSWEEEMLWALVGRRLGFPRWPSVNAPTFSGRTRIDYKAKAVRAHLDEDPRPFAWVDDHLRPRRPNRLITELPLDRLLISPDKYVGLTSTQVDALLAFARLTSATTRGTP